MKKFSIVALFTLINFLQLEAKDISNRIFLVYVGGGFTGGFLPGELQQLTKPVYPEALDNTHRLNSQYLCQESTCTLGALSGGVNAEAGVKMRPFVKLIELDVYANFASMYLIGAKLPNQTQLRDKRSSFDDFIYEKPNTWDFAFSATLNADVTVRIWRIGLTGGIGVGLWGRQYNAILQNRGTFNRGETKETDAGYLDGAAHINAGISYQHQDMEYLLRFTMPLRTMTSHAKGNNGIIDYDEIARLQYYTLSIVARKNF